MTARKLGRSITDLYFSLLRSVLPWAERNDTYTHSRNLVFTCILLQHHFIQYKVSCIRVFHFARNLISVPFLHICLVRRIYQTPTGCRGTTRARGRRTRIGIHETLPSLHKEAVQLRQDCKGLCGELCAASS